jgi:hypothetical protein
MTAVVYINAVTSGKSDATTHDACVSQLVGRFGIRFPILIPWRSIDKLLEPPLFSLFASGIPDPHYRMYPALVVQGSWH